MRLRIFAIPAVLLFKMVSPAKADEEFPDVPSYSPDVVSSAEKVFGEGANASKILEGVNVQVYLPK